MTRTHLLATALLAALLSSGAVAANADPLPFPTPSIPSVPQIGSHGYIPERPLPLPDPKWPLLPRLAPTFPAIPWLPTLPTNPKDHPLPIPLPPKFHFPEVPTPTPLPTRLALPTCKNILPSSSSTFLAAEHLDIAAGTVAGHYGVEDPQLVTLLTSRTHISCTWRSSTSTAQLTISVVLLNEPADSTALLARFTALGYGGGEAIGYGIGDEHRQQYSIIPSPTGPAIARLPYWIAVQDNAGGYGEPYAVDAQDQFLAFNGIVP